MTTTVASFATFHRAAEIIDRDGIDGFYRSAELIGVPNALCLLVGHLRRELGPLDPGDQELDDKVNAFLEKHLPSICNFLKGPHVLFYTSETYFLDNCSAYTVRVGDITYPTLEHAYQAGKFRDQDLRQRILEASSPYEDKRLANTPEFKPHVRSDWEEIKVPLMKSLMLLKRDQHLPVVRKLYRFQGVTIIEDSSTDSFWGRGPTWDGKNMAGKLWMEISDEA